MAKGEIQPTALKIDRIVSRIKDGDIKIPAFQRGYIWNQDQITDLLDSIYHNYPIGSILLWSFSERLKSSRNIGGLKIPDREPEYPVNYVLDGQQRLATIYAVFCSQREYEESDDLYKIDPKLFEIAFRFEDEKFIPLSSVEPSQPYINLSCLLDTGALLKAIDGLPEKYKKPATDLYSTVNNYEIPILTIYRRSKTEVGEIFERINHTGTTLSTLDLLVAWTWSEDFHLKEALGELKDTLDVKGFGDLPDKVFLQCIGGILAEDARTKTILLLDPNTVRTKFPKVGATIISAIDFLSTEFKIQSQELLPHMQQIVSLSYFFNKTNTPTGDQISALKKWFWKTSFSRRYAAQTDDKINADIGFMKKVSNSDYSGLNAYVQDINKSILLKYKFSKGHPYTRALLLLLAQKSPLNLTNGSVIDTGNALTYFNQKEYHHIFPKAFLKRREIPTDKINCIVNYCFIPAGANKIIASKKPSDYIFLNVPDDKRKEILESNMMPLKLEVYTEDNYDEFLSMRAEIITIFVDSLAI